MIRISLLANISADCVKHGDGGVEMTEVKFQLMRLGLGEKSVSANGFIIHILVNNI